MQLHVGKALLFGLVATRTADGSVTDAFASTSTGNENVLRVTMNPDDNRQFAVVGLGVGTVNANIHIGAHTEQILIGVVQSEVDTLGVDVALTLVGEIDPPSWA